MKFQLSRVVLVLMLSAALGGCSLLQVGPDYQLPSLSLPGKWFQANDTASPAPAKAVDLAEWWKQLADPQLDALIERALQGSLDLRAAQARLRQARASRDLAVAGLAPSVSASTGATRNKSSEAVSGKVPSKTLYDAGFDASWELDVFGGTRRGIEAASADQAASQASLDNARVSLVAEVALNYIELRGYQSRLAIARANLVSQSETLEITRWRNQAGLATALDVEQALTTREQTRASIPDLQSGLVQAENRLAVLLGQNPGTLHAELAAVRPLPDVPAQIASGIPADVLRQRPDLIAAERTLAAETARVGQKMAARFPSLSLSGSFGWQAYSFGALGGSDSLVRALGGTLAATLFDGGRLRSQVEVQNAVQEQALVAYESSVLTALEEVENALAAHAAGRERVEARRQAAEAARNAAQLARQLYESGLTDFQKVLETERTLLTAEDSLANAETTVLTSLIQLYKALGGGWQAGGSGNKNNAENT
jgi:outer membrane protein, multidrug efflux system